MLLVGNLCFREVTLEGSASPLEVTALIDPVRHIENILVLIAA